MNGSHWSDGHVEWLRDRFPELNRGPIYLRLANEIPTIERVPRAMAWTGAALDLRIRPTLEQRGQWAGRGLAIVVEHVDRFFAMRWPDQAALLVHELSHGFDVLDSPQRRDDFQWTEDDEWLTSENIDAICAALGMPPITDAEVEKINHGSTFTRSALHCWWRCRHEFSIDQMHVFTDAYNSPEFGAAFTALRSELATGGSIVEILRSPMPVAFSALWK